MTRSRLVRIGRAALPALGLIAGGCQGPDPRTARHASADLLDSGPSPRVSGRQAADVQVALGRTNEEQGRFDQARAAYAEALKRDPKRADAEVRLAILDDRQGDTAGADRHFARALKLRPKDPEILCDRGYSLYLRRRWADSVDNLEAALALAPSHARSHANLALVRGRQGDAPGALAEFARAGLDPADARSNLALVYALEGKLDESKREYALALAAKPASAGAKEGLRVTTAALLGRPDPRALAPGDLPALPVDPALLRASASVVR